MRKSDKGKAVPPLQAMPSSSPPPQTGKLTSSGKSVEVPEQLRLSKSARGKTVSVQEAQMMKMPGFVAQQLSKEAAEWTEYDQSFGKDASRSLDELEMMEVLGQGRFGQVRKCREKKTGEICAIKIISRVEVDDLATCIQHALVERRILSSLQHPYICGFRVCSVFPSVCVFLLQISGRFRTRTRCTLCCSI
jgi:hypothetical protein